MKYTATSIIMTAIMGLLVVPAQTAAAAQPRVDKKDHGIYATRLLRKIPQPRSVSGQMNLIGGVKLKRKATVIAAQMGRSFGWRFRITGIPANARLTFRTEHPPLTNPKTGKTMRFSERSRVISAPWKTRYTGYTFDYSWEMAEGIWKFQILYKGQLIGEQAFKIVVLLN
jgi:hypothetical protein